MRSGQHDKERAAESAAATVKVALAAADAAAKHHHHQNLTNDLVCFPKCHPHTKLAERLEIPVALKFENNNRNK